MNFRLESSSTNDRLFKGPEGTNIDIEELRRIKVDIHRNLTTTETSHELQREILDAEDVKLKRRQGNLYKMFYCQMLKIIVRDMFLAKIFSFAPFQFHHRKPVVDLLFHTLISRR